MATKKKTEESGKTIKYFVKTRNDEFVIELLEEWKVTFAAVNPATTGPRGDHCIRVYEMPGSKLRAVFDGAIGIRDMSIPLAHKVKHEMGESKWSKDSMGNFKEEIEVETDVKYLDEGDHDPFK